MDEGHLGATAVAPQKEGRKKAEKKAEKSSTAYESIADCTFSFPINN